MLIITSSFHLALTRQSCRESEEAMVTKQRRLIGAPGEGRSPVLAMLVLVTLAVTAPFAEAQGSPSSSNNNNNNNNYPYNGLNNFNPSMAIVIVVLISAFFFLGFFSIYIRQCAGNGSGGASTAGPRLGAALSRRQRGLDPALLETFPTLVYSEVKGLKIGKGALECAVCLSEFEDNETLRLLPACNHAFHPDCIDAWLTSHVTCPVCRANLAETSAEHAALETDPEATASDSEAVLEDRPNTAGAGGDQTDNATPQRPDFVAITVDDSMDAERRLSLPPLPPPELMDLKRLTSKRQAARAKSVARSPRFPRSHSTGHSVVQPGENPDRYTLRLPEHIRREIVAAGRLQRTKSFPANAGAAGEGSSRGGWRMGGGGGEGSSRGGRSTRLGRSDRWPSLLMRTLSLRVPAWRRGDGEGSVKKGGGGDMEGSSKGKFAAVRGPFDCLGGGAKTDAAASPAVNESPSAPLARV